MNFRRNNKKIEAVVELVAVNYKSPEVIAI